MNAKTWVLIVILVAMVAYGGYYLGTKNTVVTPQPTPITSTPTPYTATGTATPTVDETAALIAAVKQGLVAKHGPDANSLNVTVSVIQGSYAKGMASASAGGGMWFAAKSGGVWKLVWDGNGTIDCSNLTAYPDFPNAMIPECWNATTQKNVTR